LTAEFPLGLDEVNIGGHPLTTRRCSTKPAPICCRLCRLPARRGDWLGSSHVDVGRCLLKHPKSAARPRDVVICNWQYTPDGAPATTIS